MSILRTFKKKKEHKLRLERLKGVLSSKLVEIKNQNIWDTPPFCIALSKAIGVPAMPNDYVLCKIHTPKIVYLQLVNLDPLLLPLQ